MKSGAEQLLQSSLQACGQLSHSCGGRIIDGGPHTRKDAGGCGVRGRVIAARRRAAGCALGRARARQTRGVQYSASFLAKIAAGRRVRRESAGLLNGPEVSWVEAGYRARLSDLGLMKRTGAVVAGVQGLAVNRPHRSFEGLMNTCRMIQGVLTFAGRPRISGHAKSVPSPTGCNAALSKLTSTTSGNKTWAKHSRQVVHDRCTKHVAC